MLGKKFYIFQDRSYTKRQKKYFALKVLIGKNGNDPWCNRGRVE